MTARRLLATPEWATAVTVEAGEAALDRQVRLVNPVLDLSAEHSVAAGELLVVVRRVESSDWRIDALLRRVADVRGVGVLLPAGPAMRATRMLADRLGVLLASTTAAPLDLVVGARLSLAAPDLDRAELLLATHRALEERLRTPEDVVAVLGGLLRAAVALVDDRGDRIAGDMPVSFAIRANEPVPQRIDVEDGVLLAHPVQPGVWLVAQVPAIRTDVVSPALALAAGAVQRWLLSNRVELERDARSRAALLADLLRLDGEPTADLQRRAVDAGWQLGGWHVGIRIGCPSTVDTVARGQDVATALRQEAIAAVVVEHGDGWSVWTTFDQEPTAEHIRLLGARLQSAQRDLRQTMHAHMGVGRPHPRPEGLARTLGEATDAARLAAARPESGNFLHVDQLGMAQLLLEWTRTDTFEPAARALLSPLRGLPGDLIRTLSAYLDAESSITETAAVLGVHRNTVAARIVRVEQVLGVNLTHRDERLALHLACRTVTLSDDQHL